MELTSRVRKAGFIMNLTRSDDLRLWTGVAKVVPRPTTDLLDGADGAYVGLAALAVEKDSFYKLSEFFFDELGFDMIELDEIELIADQSQLKDVDPSVVQSIEELNSDAPLTYGKFHCYRASKGTEVINPIP